jgi:hypothetical protein
VEDEAGAQESSRANDGQAQYSALVNLSDDRWAAGHSRSRRASPRHALQPVGLMLSAEVVGHASDRTREGPPRPTGSQPRF